MSRIGRMPVVIPNGVQVTLEGQLLTVKGPKGELVREIHPDITVSVDGEQLVVTRPSDDKEHRSLHGLTRALINNMVVGVTTGFEKKLEIVGVGYRAAMQGKNLVLIIGYSHPVEIVPDESLTIDVTSPTKITVSGIDKEKVGALAANIRAVREPEPYKGKGIKYEGEFVQRKAGKTGAKK